mmetsp:Transcript_147371/g.271878  ORF Transcript_147371/g.271878 Transcript_147371/m.271878 type:complete len:227 (-) Transcript_147371:118-798(-)
MPVHIEYQPGYARTIQGHCHGRPPTSQLGSLRGAEAAASAAASQPCHRVANPHSSDCRNVRALADSTHLQRALHSLVVQLPSKSSALLLLQLLYRCPVISRKELQQLLGVSSDAGATQSLHGQHLARADRGQATSNASRVRRVNWQGNRYLAVVGWQYVLCNFTHQSSFSSIVKLCQHLLLEAVEDLPHLITHASKPQDKGNRPYIHAEKLFNLWILHLHSHWHAI